MVHIAVLFQHLFSEVFYWRRNNNFNINLRAHRLCKNNTLQYQSRIRDIFCQSRTMHASNSIEAFSRNIFVSRVARLYITMQGQWVIKQTATWRLLATKRWPLLQVTISNHSLCCINDYLARNKCYRKLSRQRQLSHVWPVSFILKFS